MNLNIPIMSKEHLASIVNLFNETPFHETMQKLELITVKRDFPNVINLVCDGKPRYIQLDMNIEDFMQDTLKEAVEAAHLTEREVTLYTQVKEKLLEQGSQVCLDIPTMAYETAVPIIQKQKQIKSLFEAPSELGDAFRRIVINVHPE